MQSTRLIVVTAAMLFAIACGGESSPTTAPTPTPAPTSPTPTPAPAPGPGPQSASVVIPTGAEFLGNRAFVPGELSVAVGTAVTWTNTDATSHTSTSDAPGFSSGIVGPGRTFSFTFRTPGTFPYHCEIHPSMIGTVVVR